MIIFFIFFSVLGLLRNTQVTILVYIFIIFYKLHVFQQKMLNFVQVQRFSFWAIGKIPHLKISCHSQNLSFWSNQLCRIKKNVRWGFSVLFWTPSEPHTLVSTKIMVSNIATLHTPCQPLSFSTISKEQPLFISVIQLTPVFQPILTVTFHNKIKKNYHQRPV